MAMHTPLRIGMDYCTLGRHRQHTWYEVIETNL